MVQKILSLRQHEINKSLDWFWFRESMKDTEDLGRVRGGKKKKKGKEKMRNDCQPTTEKKQNKFNDNTMAIYHGP